MVLYRHCTSELDSDLDRKMYLVGWRRRWWPYEHEDGDDRRALLSGSDCSSDLKNE